MTVTILNGDCLDVLRTLPTASVDCCVTSPPYFGLRDYGVAGQIGLEDTPDAYVERLVDVFRKVHRVLRDDGMLWLNLGDSYQSSGRRQTGRNDTNRETPGGRGGSFRGGVRSAIAGGADVPAGLKPKDLIGIPWRVAFALQAEGWYLRQDIIWAKPNPMPESVTDRCTKAHEYVFMLSKSARYFYDADAIAEPLAASSVERLAQPNLQNQSGSDRVPGKTNGRMKAVAKQDGHGRRHAGFNERYFDGTARPAQTRNKRSVWSITTKPFKEAHFAVMPVDLADTCIKAGCRPGGTVLDPFGGAGTTGLVASRNQRNAILIELNEAYAEIARRRIADEAGLFNTAAVQP